MKKSAASIRNSGLASKTSAAILSKLTLLNTNQSASPDKATLRNAFRNFLDLLPNKYFLNPIGGLILAFKIGSYHKFSHNAYGD